MSCGNNCAGCNCGDATGGAAPTPEEYLTARTARNNMLKARGTDGSYKKVETEEILKKILDAATKGDESMYVSSIIDPIVMKRLRVLGYEITDASDPRAGYSYYIKW